MSVCHVAFIIDGLAGGGAEKVVLTLAGGMLARGLDVTLISLRAEMAYTLPDGVRFIQLEDRYRGPLRRQTEIRRRARALDAAVAGLPSPPQLIISNLPKTDRIVAASSLGTRAWYCLHGAVAKTQLERRSGLARILKKHQLKNTYGNNKLIAVGRGVARDILESGGIQPAKLEIIDNPVDLPTVRQLAMEPCPMDGERFIVHVGRFHPVKRHDRLLEAFASANYPGKLVLVGKGSHEETADLKQRALALGISPRVVLAGFQSNPYPWMRAAEALVLSSDHEGFGLVLVEAMACGTPVVSTRYHPDGPNDILQGELARWIVEPSCGDLARAIDEVTTVPPAIPEALLRRFSVESIVDRYLALANGQSKAAS
ncbi:glycosyltransferase [Paludibacterium paludis]|uniref:Glycosyl transferase n=1 Tax=Paludibacterium paludis TaxID=1225769 RepID=A0A918UAA3_9NEIS|nr:glycosyltransferase [Paludibacterium paludis]GGY16591.1 glycosyl transferase [Paludibacterium paludis]